MEIAIYGGTFDPPTHAHEAIIEACLEDSRFDEVWLMPSGVRSDKPHMTSDVARMGMLDLLKHNEFQDDPRLVVSDFELRLPRPTKTYLTHLALCQAFPEHTFWWVLGADSYATMESWEHGAEMKTEVPLVVVPRLGYELPPESPRLRHVADFLVMHAGLSSTHVRECVHNHQPIDPFVSADIDHFIDMRHLYA